MTRTELQQYWRYYLNLEKRFIETISYTELDVGNDNAFSNNYALLIQAIGAEMDTVFKLYCGFSTNERKCIVDYANAIYAEENAQNAPSYIIDHKFRDQQIWIPAYNMTIQPFVGWDSTRAAQSLSWWQAFDKLKHDRYDNRALANQKNTLNILGGLYLLEMKFLKKVTEGTDEMDVFDYGSDLFMLKGWSTKVVPLNQAFAVLDDMFDKGDNYVHKPMDV